MEPAGLSALWIPLVALAAVALWMVVAMVRFTAAVLLPERRPAAGAIAPGERSPVWRWGLAYLLSWLGILGALVALLRAAGEELTGGLVLLLLLVPVAWLLLNALFIAFAQILLRGRGRSPEQQERLPDLREDAFEAELAARAASSQDASVQVANGAEERAAPVPEPVRRRRPGPLGRVLRTAVMAAVVLAFLVLGQLLPGMAALEAHLAAHQRAWLALTLALAAGGLALLIYGTVRLSLEQGREMSRQEMEAMAARRLPRPGAAGVWRRSRYRARGPALGAQGEVEVSFSEMKAAFQARAWRFSRRWRWIFSAAAGAAGMTCGLFGLVIVLAPAGIKLLAAAALAYALVRTVTAFRRA